MDIFAKIRSIDTNFYYMPAALEDMIAKAVVELQKYGLGEDLGEQTNVEWKPLQFWTVAYAIAKADQRGVGYDEIRFSPFFKGDESPLVAMERQELISVVHKDGRPWIIKAGRPVYTEGLSRFVKRAFWYIVYYTHQHRLIDFVH